MVQVVVARQIKNKHVRQYRQRHKFIWTILIDCNILTWYLVSICYLQLIPFCLYKIVQFIFITLTNSDTGLFFKKSFSCYHWSESLVLTSKTSYVNTLLIYALIYIITCLLLIVRASLKNSVHLNEITLFK